MNNQFYQNVTDYVTTINRLTTDVTCQAVKATQDFVMQSWNMHPFKDIMENAVGKKSSQ